MDDFLNTADFKLNNIFLFNGDCLEIMNSIPNNSINMILCDLPYNRTQNHWDSIIPFEELWAQYNRIIKENGCIALFSDGMFMSDLMQSNKKMWRYNLIWNKELTSGFLNANKQPLRQHEEIVIFYKKQPVFNPQFTIGQPLHGMGNKFKEDKNNNNNYGDFNSQNNPSSKRVGDTKKYPKSILNFPRKPSSKMLHPTEKSIDCCKWLINTYTNEGDLILDNCCGCGTTLVSSINTNRKCIGIEIDKNYFEISKNRLLNKETT